MSTTLMRALSGGVLLHVDREWDDAFHHTQALAGTFREPQGNHRAAQDAIDSARNLLEMVMLTDPVKAFEYVNLKWVSEVLRVKSTEVAKGASRDVHGGRDGGPEDYGQGRWTHSNRHVSTWVTRLLIGSSVWQWIPAVDWDPPARPPQGYLRTVHQTTRQHQTTRASLGARGSLLTNMFKQIGVITASEY